MTQDGSTGSASAVLNYGQEPELDPAIADKFNVIVDMTNTPADGDAMTTKAKRKYLIPNIEKMINSNFNVLLIGLHGTGKTQSILDVCKDMGLNLKAYSCATLDPYTDLVGVPVPKEDKHGASYLKMIRPRSIDEADIVFFDELNRARPEVQNAVLEIINNRSINGEKLPNLKCCIAAINPPDPNYKVTDLDLALMDRFDIYFDMKPRVSAEYMSDYMPEKTANALELWWKSLDHSKRESYISPRRLLKIGVVYDTMKDKRAFKSSFPPGSKVDTERLWQMLLNADQAIVASNGVSTSNFFNFCLTSYNFKVKKNDIVTALKDNPEAADLHLEVASAFNSMSLSPAKMCGDYHEIFQHLRVSNTESIISRKSSAWRSQARSYFELNWMRNGDKWAQDRRNIHAAINGMTKHQSSKMKDIPVDATPAVDPTLTPTHSHTFGGATATTYTVETQYPTTTNETSSNEFAALTNVISAFTNIKE